MPPARPASGRRRRRRPEGMSPANKVLFILLLAVLIGYLGLLGVSMYRAQQEEEPPPPVAAEEQPEEIVEEPPPDPADPAVLAAQDAEATSEHLDLWRSALNAMYRAKSEIERGETARAIERLEGAIEKAPLLVELKLALADLYMDQKRFAEARDLYVGVLETDPLKEGVRLKLARALHGLRHHEAALQVALWILEDDSFLEEPNQIAAMSYLATDRIADAVPHLRRQVAVNRDNIVAQNNLAVAYSRLGDHARAVTLFRDVLEADPGNAITYYNLAVSYAQQDQAALAVETLESAADRFGYPFVSAWFRSRDFDPIRHSDVFRSLEATDPAKETTDSV